MRDLGTLGDPARLSSYTRLAVALYALGIACLIIASPQLVDPSGKPFGYDFITFWSAGLITLDGNAAGAFDPATIFAAQRIAVPASDMIFLWHYPPTFQLLAAALAAMPYLVSLTVFVTLTLVAFLLAMRPLVPWREPTFLLLAFPATFICLLHGQNSLLSAALIAGALLTLDKRPILAGILIGLLAFKPQLGLLFPLALAVTGRWRTFAAAGITVAAFAGLATAVLGTDLWAVFLANTSVVRTVMETGALPWAKMPSAFIFAAKLGVSLPVAYAVQIVVAAGAAIVTVVVWHRYGPTPLAGATLVTATLLLSPYTFDYELAILAIPLAIIARDLIEHGSKRAERVMLVVLFAAPGFITAIAERTALQPGFLLLLATFAWCIHRILVRVPVDETAAAPARASQALSAPG